MSAIKVKLADGKSIEVAGGASALDVASKISNELAKKALAVRINGEYKDIRETLKDGDTLAFITEGDPDGLDVLRHSTAHVMAEAVQDLFPATKVTIGPNIEDGFYYDFDRNEGFKPEELAAIEKRMAEIIKEDRPFTREVMTREEAYELFKKLGESYKLELLDAIPPGERITVYRQGKWLDLCRGPHIQRTGQIKSFKLVNVAGAYWRGDERNQMLARIYGTAFYNDKELNDYLKTVEEAKRRDHRKLGRELDLFNVVEEVGSGLILWHPRGGIIRKTIEDFWRDEHLKSGYDIVFTPNIGKADLWQTSGHLDFYREAMYAPMNIEGHEYYIKPMNCPFHIHIYKSRVRSYRDLPVRMAELGGVYRFERSGVLHGLLRVRGFTQDDAHIFCRPDQLEEEVVRVVEFSHAILRAFGFDKFKAYIATRPPKAVGEPERWEEATKALLKAAERIDLELEWDEGGGAFYGPKIDLKLKDSLKREWQCTTVQFDFNLPERFDINYIGDDNKPHRPYMVHRALLGSIERFFGILVEHYGGAFPAWLAPEQARILTITERQIEKASGLQKKMKALRLRVTLDDSNNKLGYKIRSAETMKVPFMFVMGDRDIEKGGVSIRRYGGEDLGFLEEDKAVELVLHESKMPTLDLK
ncbi:MAG: threonine--tRNA ligase [Myxococcota bacterium]